jgi:enediyne biosynthesis protein E5
MNDDKHAERAKRLAGLRRFAVAITLLNILGHTFFGFEQSPAQPFIALAAAYSMELTLELADAWAKKRRPAFMGGVGNVIDFLLSAHISGLAVAMLLYANERLWVVAFAAAMAIGSKAIFRVRCGEGSRHFLNPSNFGITVTLLLFPWVGIAPPYHFTENLGAAGDWLLPAIIILSGSFLNARFTQKLPLILSWLVCFALQAFIRSSLHGTPSVAALLPMTGMAFILFTFYMVTDPATTPTAFKGQILFGAATAVAYSLLVSLHVVFGLFFGLTLVCLVRGLSLYGYARVEGRQRATRLARIATVRGA